MCVCVCVLEWFRISLTVILSLSLSLSLSLCVYSEIFLCVCSSVIWNILVKELAKESTVDSCILFQGNQEMCFFSFLRWLSARPR